MFICKSKESKFLFNFSRVSYFILYYSSKVCISYSIYSFSDKNCVLSAICLLLLSYTFISNFLLVLKVLYLVTQFVRQWIYTLSSSVTPPCQFFLTLPPFLIYFFLFNLKNIKIQKIRKHVKEYIFSLLLVFISKKNKKR